MGNLLIVFIGGGIGSVARYLVSLAIADRSPSFPLPTLVVNVLGCFAAGVILARMMPFPTPAHPTRLMLVVGFLGGLTTFSAFGLETMVLLKDGRAGAAGLNVMLNVLGSLLAAWGGWTLFK